jgi:chromosome segregation ATPase
MSRLDVAAERFAAALATLEKKTVPLAKVREELARANATIAELSGERETLLARIAELEDETKSLAGLTQEVEGRLDDAISEIRAALGR